MGEYRSSETKLTVCPNFWQLGHAVCWT